ncbi:sensor histidine kinase [Nonomuraea africana]|uniref:histidine kinase n=1 Tax=Nonomuraea africana TaxID=46171 RepID=A0ABR9KHW9_9ACTN|nr:histidine kinase [Nonomuraea africana]MBE1561605.1 signal transduction histidine kinase [Nonomuraea africana]
MNVEYRWLLPSVLLGDPDEGRPARRSTRDWLVDIVIFLLTCTLVWLTLPDLEGEGRALRVTEQVLGGLSCAAVWLRRRWPVTLSLVATVLSSYFLMVGGAAVVALFTVAVHRPFKISGPVLAANLVTLVPLALWRPDKVLGPLWMAVFGTVLGLAIFGWGIVVRSRRQLVHTLRAQAKVAGQEARRMERERIAREMHDVLAHRISILSLHAGALEFRPDAPPEQVARAAGAIRESAHEALQDLREVIGVLRQPGDPEEVVPERPQPTLADLEGLAEESRRAGMDVTLVIEAPEAPEAPAGLGRNAYRIVQEALTNARKHAPGAPVRVSVTGTRREGLTIEARNKIGWPSSIPGAGSGLIGLAERAELAGGRLEHRRTPEGDFVLKAWLPWRT